MKLTRSSRYLSLLLDTFESQVMPDLQSPGVRGNAGFFVNTLKELQRRELHYQQTLPSINAEGAVIVSELRAALGANAPSKKKATLAAAARKTTQLKYTNASRPRSPNWPNV